MLWIEDEDCSNDNNGAYYCSTCNLSYDSEARFEEHVIKFHSEADDCFVTKTDIASDNSTPDQNLQCPSCNQSFNDIHTLNLHTRTWNGKCCDRSDSPAPDLPDVMQLTEEFICSKCGEEFTSESCLESHMSTQHSNSPDNVQEDLSLDEQLGFADFQHSAFRQPCPICRRPFVSSKALKIHINKAHNESVTVRKPPPEQVSGIVRSHLGNTCDECGRRFPSLKQAKVHKFKAHIQPRKKREMMIRQQLELKKKTNQLPYFGTTPSQNNGSKCLDQERSRSHEHNIIRQSLNGNASHDLNHRDSPSIQQVYSLKSGGFTNSNSPSFSKTLHRCRICSQWFSSFTSLLSHRQIYHSQKTSSDYKANLNKAISNSSESISADSPNPNVEGLYTCHLCRKRFRAKTALRRHLFVHEHGKAFKCRQCGNSYTRLYSLKMHRRNCSKKMASIVATRPHNQHDQVIPSSSPQIISGPYMSIVQSANGGKAFRCRVCKRHFMNKKAVTSHLVKFHNLKGSGLTSTNPKLIDQSDPIHPMAEPVVSDNDEVKSLENSKPIEETSDGFACSFCNRVFTTPKGVTSHKVHMHYHLMKQEMKQHKSGGNWTLQGLRNNHQHESGHLPSQNNRHLNQINHAVSHNKSNLPAFPLPNPNERSRFLNPPSSRSGGQQQPMPRPGGANSTAVRCPECRVLLPSQQFLDAHQKKFHASSSSILPSANHDSTTKNLHPSSSSSTTTGQQKQTAVSRMSLTTNSNAQSRTIEAAAISKVPHSLCSN